VENNLGSAFRKARKVRKWTVNRVLTELDAFDAACSPTYITKIENMSEIPTPELIVCLSRVLGLSPIDMLEMGRKCKLKEFEDKLELRYRAARKKYLESKQGLRILI